MQINPFEGLGSKELMKTFEGPIEYGHLLFRELNL